tara:strand:+ start:75 stop:449 length:375 start_codon:yes stop_codon:yes gene_type:complete
MKKSLLTLFATTSALTSNASIDDIEIYFFWLTNYGYTCSVSDSIITQLVKQDLPTVKYEVVNLDEQPSSDFIKDTNYQEKVVVILNKKTGYYQESSIRELIYYQTPVEDIKDKFIQEITQVLSK